MRSPQRNGLPRMCFSWFDCSRRAALLSLFDRSELGTVTHWKCTLFPIERMLSTTRVPQLIDFFPHATPFSTIATHSQCVHMLCFTNNKAVKTSARMLDSARIANSWMMRSEHARRVYSIVGISAA
jgi:hypothetical protein